MMSSNVLSRFLPPANSPSVYEAIRQHDEESAASDLEERAGVTLPDGVDDHYSDHELEDALADATDSPIESPSTAFLTQVQPQPSTVPDEGFRHRERQRSRTNNNPRWLHPAAPHAPDPEDGDDDVPASLLIEGDEADEDLKARLPPPPQDLSEPESPAPGPSSRDHVSHRESARVSRSPRRSPRRTHWMGRRSGGGQHPALAMVDPKEKAMWRWANVENLDNFLKDVYIYFLGNGIWSILLSRALNLLTFAFVVGFTTFLTSCVNYSNFRGSKKLDDILIDRCMAKMSGSSTFLLWLLTFFWIGKLFQYLLDIRRLKHMHDFYLYLLGITDVEIQTISWQEVVSRLMALRDANPATANAVSARHRKFIGSQSKQRMDAHDIANRLMRKENYLIALINKDILDLTLPLPFLRNRPLFSRTLEWNINLCVMDFVFNEHGQVRPLFLKDTYRRALSEGLRRRFIFAGIMNIFMAPFIVVYFLMHYFFRYFNEFKKNPSQIGSRQYTPLAEWKFREFNELWHLFERRINMSYPFAGRYVDQFPKDKTVQVARFVAFVTGALASVLALASVVDPELFLGFEITHDRTVLFYLGVFGSVWAVARGLVPEETDVFDPEFALLEVIDFTHYFPTHWKGRLHSDEVRTEFAALYQMKIVVFLEEILSMIFTPFVLWFSLPKCSDRLIDFFREFTVHVDGMGYLCSFAVFDFKKGTNVLSQGATNRRGPARNDPRADYFSTKDGKMLASYYGFLDNYGVNHHRDAAARRHFHPPPAFPTLGSPAAGPSAPVPDRFDHIHSRIRASPAHFGQQSMMAGFSRLGVGATGVAEHHHSPIPSMLLDPHHQPSTSGFRSATRAAGRHPRQRRPARGSRPRADPIEDVDERSPSADARNSQTKPPPPPALVPAQAPPGGGSSSGQAGASESNLDESWRMNLAGDADENEAAGFDEGENVDELVGGGGVLGLIQQFQKVNSEGRGRTTVGI